MLQDYQKQRQALMQERQKLIESRATEAQLQAWREKTAARFADLQDLAEAMGAASALHPKRTDRKPNIPANASPTLAAFLTTRAELGNARAKIHNQLLDAAAGQELTPDQVRQMQEKERQLFLQQHAAELQLQAQRTQTLAVEAVSNKSNAPARKNSLSRNDNTTQ